MANTTVTTLLNENKDEFFQFLKSDKARHYYNDDFNHSSLLLKMHFVGFNVWRQLKKELGKEG